MGNNVGSIRKAVLDGVTYDVPADSNITFPLAGYSTEGLATSGKTMFKMTKRVRTIESMELAVTPAELIVVKGLAEQLSNITMSIEIADGSVFKASGRIDFEGYESETGKLKIKLIPDGDWTPFLA